MTERRFEKRIVEIAPLPLEGILRLPPDAIGLVVFAHGAGSSRLSPRNNFVAEALTRRGIATLLFDLLTPEEATNRANVFDISLLARRVVDAVDWVERQQDLADLPLGLFGASTGAAAALVAAARAPGHVRAVVSRGGRPDLASDALARVRAPVLLIVGGHDDVVLDLNAAAAARLTCPCRTEIVPGATHLFTEPGTLDRVVDLAGDWFEAHFTDPAPA